jgi:hypothetical protein
MFMRHFFIQNGDNLPDFCYEAFRAAEYANWLDPGSVAVHRIRDAGFVPLYPGTPIGSVEFVSAVAMSGGAVSSSPQPLNVPGPLVLNGFAGRRIWKAVLSPPSGLPKSVFVKSALIYKGFSGVVPSSALFEMFEKYGPLDLSEEVEFGDEWRAFVHAGKLVGLHCYSGLFERVPSRHFIGSAIDVLAKDLPTLKSYTIDVGFIGESEAVVEVHPFVACGLYGFRDYRILLNMFEQGYKSFLTTI